MKKVKESSIKEEGKPTFEGSSVVFWTLHKAGSRYFWGALKRLCKSSGMIPINYASQAFQKKQKIQISEADAKLTQALGHFYGPFRIPNEMPQLANYQDMNRFLVVRDPRDILTSYYFSNKFSHQLPGQEKNEERPINENVEAIDDYVLKIADRFLPRWESYLDMVNQDEKLKIYKYEWIIDNFENWITEMTSFMEIKPRQKAVDFVLTSHSNQVDEEDVSKHKRQVRPGDHLRKLKPETITTLNEKYSEVLKKFDYK